jgi:hypothetical protein
VEAMPKTEEYGIVNCEMFTALKVGEFCLFLILLFWIVTLAAKAVSA